MRPFTIGIGSFVASIWLVTAGTAPSYAQGGSSPCAAPAPTSHDLFSLDLDSLLQTKVVTASKVEERVADAPGVVSVISRDDLRRFGGMTLGEILNRVPGLTTATSPLTDRSMLTARGDQTRGTSGHVLFLVDGRPTREVLEGGVSTDLVESFPVGVLERVEVIKGPGSVLYGSNAYSAVVNLITIKPEGNGMSVTALGGSPGALGTDAQALFTCGRFSLVGAAQFRHADTWSTPYRYEDLFTGEPGTATASIPERSPSAFVKANYGGLNATSLFTQSEDASFLGGEIGVVRWKRGFADVSYSTALGTAWDVAVSGSYTRSKMRISKLPFVDRDSQELVLEWTNTLRATADATVTLGGLYGHMRGREIYFGVTPEVEISDGRRRHGAVYAQVDYQLPHGIKAIGGFQANKFGALGLDVVPRAGAIWNPTEHVNVKALWGQAFRAPSINETVINHPGLLGNPSLKPEKASTFDLAMTYRADRVEAGVSYFRHNQTNTIGPVPAGDARFMYANFGEATFNGFEVDGKYYVDSHLYLVGSTLYQRNRDDQGRDGVVQTPGFAAKIGASYQSERLTASLFDSYQSTITTPLAGANPAAEAFHLVNAHVRVDLSRSVGARSLGALALVLHVNNLRDTQVWLPHGIGGIGASDTVPTERGRTLYVGAQVGVGIDRRAAR